MVHGWSCVPGFHGLITAVGLSVGFPTLCFLGRLSSNRSAYSWSRTYENSGNLPDSWWGVYLPVVAVLELQVSHPSHYLILFFFFFNVGPAHCGTDFCWAPGQSLRSVYGLKKKEGKGGLKSVSSFFLLIIGLGGAVHFQSGSKNLTLRHTLNAWDCVHGQLFGIVSLG